MKGTRVYQKKEGQNAEDLNAGKVGQAEREALLGLGGAGIRLGE